MTCKLCERFWVRLWEESDDWERAHSNESELWSEESQHSRELIKKASAALDTDSAAAFRLHLEAAEARSIWCMERVGWHYQTGTGIAADPRKALEYFHQAISAGSWMATIYYARALAELGHFNESDRVLEAGVASGFVPASFWFAWLRYDRSKTREVCREVRPLLEFAANRGHPAAKLILARWMLLGRFGLREVLPGLRQVLRLAILAGTGAARG